MRNTDLRIYKALRKTGAKPLMCISYDTNLVTDLAFDEVDLLIFGFYLETLLNIRVEDHEIRGLCTIESVLKLVEQKKEFVS